MWKWVEDKEKASNTLFGIAVAFQLVTNAFVVYAYVRFWLGMKTGIAALV